jgi:hypothetical protein
VVSSFPDECRYVIETLGKVYKNDEIARRPSGLAGGTRKNLGSLI